MTALAEQLQTWAARQPMRPTVSPVSRIVLEITDTTAFEQVIQEAVRWMRKRANATIGNAALAGEPFDVTDIPGANPCKAIRYDEGDLAVWAARLDDPDKEIAQRAWRTELFVARRGSGVATFGAQLTCVTRGEAAPIRPSRPGLVRQIVDRLSAEADGWQMTNAGHLLAPHENDDFVALLRNPERRLPVVAVSADEHNRSLVDHAALAATISGAAHIVLLDYDRCMDLTRAVGKQFSVFNGATRLYLPGFDEDTDDRFRHPLWLMPEDGARREVIPEIAQRVFGVGLSAISPARFVSVTQLHRLVAERQAAVRAPSAKTSDHPRHNTESLIARAAELEEERDSAIARAEEKQEEYENAWSLAQGREADYLRVSADLDRAREEIARLRARARTLEAALSAGGIAAAEEQLDSLEDLESWANTVLGDHIVLIRKALNERRKVSTAAAPMTAKIAKTLLAIRDIKIPVLLGRKKIQIWNEFLAMEQLADGACFSNRREARSRAEYAATYEGTTYVLEDHIKFRSSTNIGEAFRIYYVWDSDKQLFIIGWLPSHLDNNLTN